ncbi:hypothetical protein T281_12880 [Rhodomicrobium udaipurense JA643]|uniref:Uncharacterized protein n=1 Tax=Rhodomicrobium udaipurense TaxID=1202716 RepID=A0A8I1KJ21_9HYPH|nr:hypothetical protein [Rhodomicrobium udaipurense]KAI94094.1 hypothetical protein T281_12880 [Rhodomicrobium udaipurense JA643]MBJ7543267.1 hypothetical protein [Rhodomicrobium udaipurense]
MTKIVKFSEAEVAEPSDFDAISAYARAGDEALASGAIAYPHHWADHTVSNANAVEVTINSGSLFAGGLIYRNDDPIIVNLQVHLPLVTGDRRYVALLLRGEEEIIGGQRLVETDADTGETVEQSVPKTGIRKIVCVVQQGLPSPTPLKPTVAADQCCLAYVELSPTGIVAIEMNNASRVKSLFEIDGRLSLVEGDVSNLRTRVSTIETDIANIASRLGDIPSPAIIRQMKRDLSILRRTVAMPDEARAYWYDAGLLQDAWDKANASWLARVREGIRFPWAAERDAQLALIDESSNAIRFFGRLLLPSWTEVTRLAIDGDGGSKNISQLVHTVTTAVRRELSRTVTEYGPTVSVCENNAEWSNTAGLDVGELFTKNGETWTVVSIGDSYGRGHTFRSVAKLIQRTVTDVYWDHVTESFGVNGSVYGQTWLCAQPMVLTSVDIKFTRVASTGDVHMFLCECSESGEPQFNKVLAKTTLTAADLATGWVRFSITPRVLESGKRYAWFTVTTGNHALETVSGNKFAQGSLFWATDGAWAQGDPLVDFAMRLNAASFASARTVVEFQPLTLENGMTEIRLLTAGWAPGGTALVWEVKPSDSDTWQPLTLDSAAASTALNGLPALVQLRAVFTGTTDLQPALVLDAYARGMTFRPRGDMTAVSKDHAFGVSTTTVQLEIVLDQYDAAKHTAAPKLVIGGTVLTPTTLTITPDLVAGKKRTLLANFVLGTATTAARARIDMTTTEVTDLPFVQNIALYAL